MIIIGEKINGSIPSVAKAIAERDEEKIKKLAIDQSEAGATYIDVCASVEDDIEVETMMWLIDLIHRALLTAPTQRPASNACSTARDPASSTPYQAKAIRWT